jgi:integrase
VEALIEAAPARYRALIVLGAGTGLRQGEAFGLTIDRVDFLRRQLTVDRQLLLMPGGAPTFAPPKTNSSYRSIPLPDVVRDALAAHLRDHEAGPDGLIFTNDRGEPVRRTRFSDVWRPMIRAANAPEGTGYHALRHYYASLLIRHGESVKTVQARLGHKNAAETLDTYSHLWPDSEDRTRSAVDTVLGSSGLDTTLTRKAGRGR